MSEYFAICLGNHRWGYLKDNSGVQQQKWTPDHQWKDINIEMDCDQEVIINKIFDRRKQTIFGIRDGKLSEIYSWEYQARFTYWRNISSERAAVNECVTKAMTAFDNAIAKLTNLSDDQEVVLKRFLQDQFFSTLTRAGPCARMREDVFNRDAISLTLPNGIADRLAPEVKKSKQAIAAEMKNHRLLSDKNEARTALRVADYLHRDAKVAFSQKLGVPLKKIGSGGSGGARTGHALSKKKVTVIKPGDEGPYGVNTPSWSSWLKQFLFSARKCLLWQSEPRAEEASSRMAEVLNLHNTPHTRTEMITATNFNGRSRKECSQQVFMGIGRVQTLGEYLGISGSWSSIPRFLRCCLADHLARRGGSRKRIDYPHANSWWKSVFRWFFEKLDFSSAPLPPVDSRLFELSALGKYLSGDIDTHFDNMLVALLPKEAFTKGEFLDRYFKGEALENEIDTFIEEEKNLDLLLARLFESREMENGEHMVLLNHDGGAAFPNQHPSTWGLDSYLSGRHRFLFETHPEFSKRFSDEAKDYILGKEQIMLQFMLENALRELIGVIGVDIDLYKNFRMDASNRALLKKYIFLGDEGDLENLTRRLINLKMKNHFIAPRHYIYYDKQFRGDLQRIHGMTNVTADLYRFALHHMSEKSHLPKRELFMHIDANNFKDDEIKKCAAVKKFDQMRAEFAQAAVPKLKDIPGDANYEFFRKGISQVSRWDYEES